MTDQLTLVNPVDRFAAIRPPEQQQPEPGLDERLEPKADHGEETYRGTGRLQGRKALVTGGDSGIGAAVALAFAREGADVAIVYLPSEDSDAERIAELIEQEGRRCVRLARDLSDPAACRELVKEAFDGLGGLDVVVNNAGTQKSVPRLEDLSDEQFDETMRTNIYSMFWISKAALEFLPAGASIINTASVQAYSPSADLVDYATTKGAINTFTKALAKQLAERGIRVNAVAPGPIWTPLQVQGGQEPGTLKEFGQKTDLGRAGQPTELAPAFVFLASAESSYVTGSTVSVTGGMPTP